LEVIGPSLLLAETGRKVSQDKARKSMIFADMRHLNPISGAAPPPRGFAANAVAAFANLC
jgi:hypothetical protein